MQTFMNINIPVAFFKEGEIFIAYTPVLDLSTSAPTYEKAKERFDEVVQIFFEELIERGTLDEILANLGWKKVKSQWNPPISVSHDITSIAIPLSN